MEEIDQHIKDNIEAPYEKEREVIEEETRAVNDESKNNIKVFTSWEEAEVEFYKSNDCMSDDLDIEGARLENWVEGMGYKVEEEEHTATEWEELKLEAARLSSNPN